MSKLLLANLIKATVHNVNVRLSATIIRGRVMVVTAAAARERGRRGNGEVPEEISAHSLG